MDGKDFREKPVLAAVKPIEAVSSTSPEVSGLRSFEAASAEDSTSLAALFQRHQGRVFRTAHRVTGSPADAEDVLQTVFLRLVRTQETPAVATNPEAYLTRAAINASLDLLRGRKRARAVAIDDVENSVELTTAGSRQNPEEHQEDRELRELIRVALSRLGSTAAQMFALRYFEGYDNGEIAQVMDTSALVVGVTLHRARARLRKEIGSYLQGHSSA